MLSEIVIYSPTISVMYVTFSQVHEGKFRFVGARPRSSRKATWFSFLAPLSWFVIFKAHSHCHTHMNFLVWQMPFTILGVALCGVASRGLFPLGPRPDRQAEAVGSEHQHCEQVARVRDRPPLQPKQEEKIQRATAAMARMLRPKR